MSYFRFKDDTDVFHTKACITLLVDVSGYSKENLFIHIDNGELIIEARQDAESFREYFPIPANVDICKISAGVISSTLIIHIPILQLPILVTIK